MRIDWIKRVLWNKKRLCVVFKNKGKNGFSWMLLQKLNKR